MKKTAILLMLTILSTFSTGFAQIADNCPIMHIEKWELDEFTARCEEAPRTYIEPSLPIVQGAHDVLANLYYVPTEYNQGNCGNCWAWASTSCLAVELKRQKGVLDRLSVQYINSCAQSVIGKACCDGGNVYSFSDFYSAVNGPIPWSNSGAYWQDGDASCDTSCGSISKTPCYPLNSINGSMIDTHAVGKQTAINNIKNVLNQNRAVYFSFTLARGSDWDTFRSKWRNQSESQSMNLDYACGHTWEENQGGGHGVTCVGYNDNDPANSYWIMVNSWGTPSGRPNCIFHLDMDMNYDCYYSRSGNYYSYYWMTVDASFAQSTLNASVSLWMPSNYFVTGDNCACVATVTNGGSSSFSGYPLFVILNVYGNYYFAPSFSGFDYYNMNFSPGDTPVTVLPNFTWPPGTGSANNIVFYAALTNPGISSLVSNLASFTFGWTDSGSKAQLQLRSVPEGKNPDSFDGQYYSYSFDLKLSELNGIGVTLDTMKWQWFDQYGGLMFEQNNGCADFGDWFGLSGCRINGGGYHEASLVTWISTGDPFVCLITISGNDDNGNRVQGATEFYGYGQ